MITLRTVQRVSFPPSNYMVFTYLPIYLCNIQAYFLFVYYYLFKYLNFVSFLRFSFILFLPSFTHFFFLFYSFLVQIRYLFISTLLFPTFSVPPLYTLSSLASFPSLIPTGSLHTLRQSASFLVFENFRSSQQILYLIVHIFHVIIHRRNFTTPCYTA